MCLAIMRSGIVGIIAVFLMLVESASSFAHAIGEGTSPQLNIGRDQGTIVTEGLNVCTQAKTLEKCIECCILIGQVQKLDNYSCAQDKSAIVEKKTGMTYMDKSSLDNLSAQLYSYLCSNKLTLSKSVWSIDECRKECKQKKYQ